MASLSNFTEIPNLLELVEASRNDLTAIWRLSESATCDEKIHEGSAGERSRSSLMDLSLCADEGTDFTETANLLELVEAYRKDITRGELSVCDDDINRFSGSLMDLSLCADEGTDLSDVRLKTDIEQVGTTVYGLPLYHFRYQTGMERFEGVMAQDVLEVMPDAVVVGKDGYYRVKYGQLGIRMTRA